MKKEHTFSLFLLCLITLFSFISKGLLSQSPKTLSYDTDKIMPELHDLLGNMEGIKIKHIGAHPVIEGQLLSYSDKKKFESILQKFPTVINLVDTRIEKPLIGLEISILEMNQNCKQPNYVSTVKLTIADCDTGFVHTGGEIPYAFEQKKHGIAQWKKYGTVIKIIPQLLSTGSVFLKIWLESSYLDHSIKIEGLPGIKRHEIYNNATIKSGKSVIIGGIYQINDVFQKKRIPILGHIFPVTYILFDKES